MKAKKDLALYGVKAMLPIIPGLIPFGVIMGSTAATNGLSFFETMGLNTVVFAGASQLASLDLMGKNSESLIIILTGLIINLRFALYSAASSPYFKKLPNLFKLMMSYLLTDQSYAVMTTHEDEFSSKNDVIYFCVGASLFMAVCWHLCVVLGFVFGNIVPSEISLDFAVPLSFMALTIPTLRSAKHIAVACISMVLSICFYKLPFNLGLIVTVAICIIVASIFINKDPKQKSEVVDG